MLHRFRAAIRFPDGHWGPTWCRDQMTVRYGQAVHIRQGEPAEESPVNVVEGTVFRCDLPLTDEAAVVDAMATLGDHNVLGQSVPLDSDDSELSWIEHHLCDHDDDERDGCAVVDKQYGPQ